ncbi:aminotransferase class IV [Leifsonia shinshuensis]|uniref:aminotransferase class IV n=1 Tax=Leifsonia TaxID=110932 RepID=UPI002860F78C|nr:aminotransferase class IV [Leifsonia shinshuensis]MDR6970445.1 branched-subunit amino acid aminotransferase/4-amino-4-deoxychorismate lyase [Leifsonia shinshuensis]
MDARTTEPLTTLADWADGELRIRDDCEVVETELLAADSFLVRHGAALALRLHRSRFADTVREQGYGGDDLAEFWEAGVAALPRTGVWFPRFELVRVRDALRLRVRVRPAPELTERLVVATAERDPRQVPHLKGPDIERLSAARQAAQRRGAQEAVLLDDGRVADGATTALLWWRDGTLFTPPLALPRVDSVAARTVRGIAAAVGVPVDEEEVRPAQLEGAVLWAVNALHGIRAVTAWVDGPALAADPARTDAWRARFAALARPLPEPGE